MSLSYHYVFSLHALVFVRRVVRFVIAFAVYDPIGKVLPKHRITSPTHSLPSTGRRELGLHGSPLPSIVSYHTDDIS